MLPCSIGSLEWRQNEQIRATCQTAAQSARGDSSGGTRRQQPRKERMEQESSIAGKSVKETQGKRHGARKGWNRRESRQGGGAELKMETGREGVRDE